MKLTVDLYKWPDNSWRFTQHEPFIEMRRTSLPEDFTYDVGAERIYSPEGKSYTIAMSADGDIRIHAEDGSHKMGLYVFDIRRA
jgi:hypothetical protein